MTNSSDENLRVTALTEADVESLTALWQRADLEYRPRGRDSHDELRRQIAETGVKFIGAFDGADLVGSIMATDDGRRGWVNRLAVHPDSRRRGIGAALIKAAEEYLANRGMRIIAALIYGVNKPSRAVFEACGYVSMPEVVYYSKREDEDV